jgi:hypothetical protein
LASLAGVDHVGIPDLGKQLTGTVAVADDAEYPQLCRAC